MTEAEIIRKALDRELDQLEVERVRREAWKAEEAFIQHRMDSVSKVGPPRKWNREEIYGSDLPGRH